MKNSKTIEEIADRIVESMQRSAKLEKTVRQVHANHRGVNADQAKRAVEKLVATGRATWKYPHPDGRVTRNSAFILTTEKQNERKNDVTKKIELNFNRIDYLVDVLREVLDELKTRCWNDPDENDLARFEAVCDLYIALTRNTDAAPCAGMRVAQLMQMMRRHGIRQMELPVVLEYAYDIHPEEMLAALRLHVWNGLARWKRDVADFGQKTQTTRPVVFEILD